MKKISIKKDDVIESLRSLKLHKLMCIAHRLRQAKASLTGIPDLFLSTKRNRYWIGIRLGRQRMAPFQKRFLSSQSNPMLLHLDPKNGRLTLYCKHTDLIINYTLGQLALTFARRTGRPWQLKQRPLVEATKEELNGNI